MHGYMGRFVTAMGGTLSQARGGAGQGSRILNFLGRAGPV
jgi:hypothetical protein